MAPPTNQFHLFSLPKELLVTLIPRTLFSQPAQSELTLPEQIEPSQEIPTTTNSRTCTICLNAAFPSVDDQRQHFRSDWHRYNVKVRLSGRKPVNEAQFSELLDELDDSLSGSASSDDEDSDTSTDAIRTLLSKARVSSSRPSSPSEDTPGQAPQTAITYFHSPPSTQLGIYRIIFSRSTTLETYVHELREMQNGGAEGRKWAMFMVAGGHFAGVVVRVSRPEGWESMTQGKKKAQKEMPEMEILRHKTFHRYTTRRKQGGSQSLNDNSKGNAKSAGAMLRRYGEQALRDDIRGLLEEWSGDISACERIWLRASGANRKIFMDYPGSVIQKGDERLRTFPFPTRRPTQSELQRCLFELTRVKVSHFTEDELREQDEAYLASLPKPKPKATATPAPAQKTTTTVDLKQAKLTKEEEETREKWERLLEMVRKGRLDSLKSFFHREGGALGGINAPVPSFAGEKGEKQWTLLMVASHEGQADVVEWLLDNGADPTLLVPSQSSAKAEQDAEEQSLSNRTAYILATTRPVRDVFRRAAGKHSERWDWFGAAKIPSALNKDVEEDRDAKKKERRRGLKDKIKEREKEREAKDREEEEREKERERQEKERRALEAASRPSKGPQKLGGGTAPVNESMAGLTPEMRARIERERRARAAEARLKALGSK